MILPEGEPLRSLSPDPYAQRPPSPSNFYAHSNRSAHTIKLNPSPRIKSPPLSAQSSRSTLRNSMGDAVPAASSQPASDDALASSPTVDDGLLNPESNNMIDPSQRRLSTTSSLNSEDLEHIRDRWSGFDSNGFDDSGVDLEEEEDRDQFPVTNADGDREGEPWLNGNSDEDDKHYSPDMYSRRAEIILANAKKRLNVGNHAAEHGLGNY